MAQIPSLIMQWYYSNNGAQLGPVTEQELKSKIAEGQVQATDLAWREGMSDWTPIGKISELAAAPAPTPATTSAAPGAPAPAPVSSAPTQPQTPATPSPYQTPAAAPGPVSNVGQGGDIPTYLWQSIVVTLLCCLPFGIAAIVYAAKVDGLKRAGDFAAARAASETAKKWCWWSFGVGLVVTIIVIVINAIAASQGMQ